ncbi:hypothetical protein [Leptolyngbya sp. O-77]|uniref:hypothetical protein n=1 Tax=Leptolyngbya sp. O-77 TaxID=1080068 RepID=UPI00074D2F85|nr:hypothetical protein [Leptolyngbya sp. O-77]BAU41657.1 hypothetical protein O77CONTIG1_01469 [Leptolyngbya sp. O-77]
MKLYMVNLKSQSAMLHAVKNAKGKGSMKGMMNSAWNALVQLLKGSNELRVRHVKLKCGDEYWEVYDPATRNWYCFKTEDGLYAWLDRHHQSLDR